MNKYFDGLKREERPEGNGTFEIFRYNHEEDGPFEEPVTGHKLPFSDKVHGFIMEMKYGKWVPVESLPMASAMLYELGGNHKPFGVFLYDGGSYVTAIYSGDQF